MLVLKSEEREEQVIQERDNSLTEAIFSLLFTYNGNAQCLAYKKVINKVRSVPGTMPKDIRIIRQFPEDPLRILL